MPTAPSFKSAKSAERAVIDVGSNTVRLVIFDGPLRAPRVVLNEKVSAKLGKLEPSDGTLSPRAQQTALDALRRYSALLRERGTLDVTVVATAAARHSTNGKEFLASIEKLGLSPRLLTGEEEAIAGAHGVIGAFPDAKGVVADLGGGSLELVHVAFGDCDHGVSLPFGSIALPDLTGNGRKEFNRIIDQAIASTDFECAEGETLYLVGGSHRALARYAMHALGWPLDDPHGFTIAREDLLDLCRTIEKNGSLAGIPGVSASRLAGLPHTSALLAALLRQIKPSAIVFSAWGLREGLQFARLKMNQRMQDPLIAGVADFTERHGLSPAFATIVAGWTADASGHGDKTSEDLRLAATMLALASQRIEPNLRASHAVDWALRKRWIGVTAQGRAMIAACALAHCNADPFQDNLLRLASKPDLQRAAAWGYAVRLCRRLGGGSTKPLLKSSLRSDEDTLVLSLESSLADLLTDSVEKDLKNLASALILNPKVKIER